MGNTEDISVGTVTGQFDLGLVEGEISNSCTDALEIKVIGSDRLVIVVGQSHPWYAAAEVSLAHLTQTIWVMRELGSGTRAVFEQALREWEIDLADINVALAMSSGEMVKAVVESGVGAAAISDLMVKKELQMSSLRSVQIEELANSTAMARSFLVLKHRQRFQTRISQAFIKLLTSNL